MEEEIVIFEENQYIKSNALFDKVFSKIQKEVDWFDDIYIDYKKEHGLDTIQVINGISIDGRDFKDLMILKCFLKDLSDKEAFKKEALKMLDAYLNYESDETYEPKLLEQLNELYRFEETALEKINTLDCSNSHELEYAIIMGRLGQCFGTKRDEFRQIIEKNMTIDDFEKYDRILTVETSFGSSIRNDMSTFKNCSIKYEYAEALMGKNIVTIDKSTLIGRIYNCQTTNILNRGLYKDKVLFDIDTVEYYKYIKLIDKEVSGKTSDDDDKQINDYITLTMSYFDEMIPNGNNEGQLDKKKLGYKWYDLVYINGVCIKDLVDEKDEYKFPRACVKLFMKASVDGKSVLNFVKLNHKDDIIKAEVLPIKVKHDQEQYKASFSWWEKVLNFIGFNIIKDIKQENLKAPLKDYSKEIATNIYERVSEKGFRPVSDNLVKIDVDELNEDILNTRFNNYINKDKEIDKGLENTK